MPNIKPSADLHDGYNKLSKCCHEAHESLNGKPELYLLLDEGRTAVNESRKRPIAEAIINIRQKLDHA